MQEEPKRRMISLNPVADAMLTNRMAMINKARADKNKKILNRNDVIACAIENLTVKQGMEK